MPGILDSVHQIIGKITGLHGAQQWGISYDLNGLRVAPAGMDGNGGSTKSNSEGVVGAAAGVYGYPPLTLNRQSGAQGNGADSTDDTLFQYTVKASTLSRTGQGLRLRAWGSFADTGNNKTIKVKFGGTTITVTGTVTGAPQNCNWVLDVTIVRTGLNTQSAIAQLEINGVAVNALPTGVTNGQIGTVNTGMTETETIDNALVLTGASASSGQNDVVCNDFKVDLEQF